jgi:hypothetical protein
MTDQTNPTLSDPREIRKLIESGRSPAGGWTREQLAVLGVPWPPPAGWARDTLGKTITPALAAEFLAKGDKR